MKKVFSVALMLCILLTCCVAGLTSVTASAADSDFEIYDGILVEYIGDAETVTIPSTVKEIDAKAFYGNETVTKVKIPETVTKIGNRAFEDCKFLEEVNIPFSVTEMSDCVFRSCESLTSITFPASLETIPGDVCANCKSLTDVTISYGVKNIQYNAFCTTPLTKIVIPASVEYISGLAFSNLQVSKFSMYVCNPMCDMTGYTEYLGKKYNTKHCGGPEHLQTICNVYCIDGSPALTQAKTLADDKYIVYPMSLETANSFPENQKDYGVQNKAQAEEIANKIDGGTTDTSTDTDTDKDTDKDKNTDKNTDNTANNNNNTLIIVIIVVAAVLVVLMIVAVVLAIVLTNNKKKKRKKKVAPKPVEEVVADQTTETPAAEEVTEQPTEEVTPADEENGTEE